MDYQSFLGLSQNMPFLGSTFTPAIIIAIAIWELAWKGWALWKAAKNNSSAWFIALLLLNTIGILPILYIYVFDKKNS